MNYLNCCLKVQSLYKISYSVRHLQVCKYLNLLSLNGMQRMFSASTNLLGHNLTQNLNRYIENSASIPSLQLLVSAPTSAPGLHHYRHLWTRKAAWVAQPHGLALCTACPRQGKAQDFSSNMGDWIQCLTLQQCQLNMYLKIQPVIKLFGTWGGPGQSRDMFCSPRDIVCL